MKKNDIEDEMYQYRQTLDVQSGIDSLWQVHNESTYCLTAVTNVCLYWYTLLRKRFFFLTKYSNMQGARLGEPIKPWFHCKSIISTNYIVQLAHLKASRRALQQQISPYLYSYQFSCGTLYK